MVMKRKSKLTKRIASMIDWCGGYAKFGAMTMITGVGVFSLLMSIFGAGPFVILTSLALIPVVAIVAGKWIP